MKVQNFILIGLAAVMLGSCETEYSPNQVFDKDSPRDLNAKNIATLLSKGNQDDTVRIAFIGDSQRFYDEAEDLVKKVNTIPGVDFLIHAGDISDFGLLQEFDWIDQQFSKLSVPYVAVIGNHDIIANGDKVYERMYGPKDFSFVFDSIKFVFHDTNGREYNFNGMVPNIPWMVEQLKPDPGHNRVITVSHVPPFDADFDRQLEAPYSRLLGSTPGFLASLHGHLHNTAERRPYDDGILYLNSNSVQKRSFMLVECVGDTVLRTHIAY